MPETPPRVASASTTTLNTIDDQDGDREQVSPQTVADDGQEYLDFDESPQNMARLPRFQREARASEERAKHAQEQFASVQAPWKRNAKQLAAWTEKYLVNRHDVWGQYLPEWDREPKKNALTMPAVDNRGRFSLTPAIIERHYAAGRVGDIIGLQSTSADATCKWVAWDIDHHDHDRNATGPALNLANAVKLYDELGKLGLHPLLSDSNGNGGYHVRVIFDSAVASEATYAFAQKIAELVQETIETFPKQATLSGKALGNWLRLPGYHHTREHFTKIWTGGQWLEGEAAIQAILSHEGDDSDIVINEAAKYSPTQCASVPASAPTIASGAVVNWLRDILKRVPDERFDDYEDWLRIGFAIYHEISDESGLALWDEASRRSKKYEDKACSKHWESFTDDFDTRVTVGTLVYWIRAHEPDYTPPRKPRADADEGDASQKKNKTPIKITSWADRRKVNPDPTYRTAVINGLLRKCEVATLISGPKMGKSWLAIQMALCVASGQRWLGLEVLTGRVLLVDCELHDETIEVRLNKVAEAMKIDIDAVAAKIDIVCLRGSGYTIRDVEDKLLNQHPQGHYTLIFLDPMFKLFIYKASEGNDYDMRQMFDRLIHAAQTAGAAVVVSHHATKGPQAKKSTTDVGSGHGVLSRSPDVHITLLPEDEASKDVVTRAMLRATPRTFPPFKGLHLERLSKEVPVWCRADCDGKGEARSCPEGQDLQDTMKFAATCARSEPEKSVTIIGRHGHMEDANGQKLTKARASVLFEKALDAGWLSRCVNPNDKRSVRYRREPTPDELHRQRQTQQLEDACQNRAGGEAAGKPLAGVLAEA